MGLALWSLAQHLIHQGDLVATTESNKSTTGTKLFGSVSFEYHVQCEQTLYKYRWKFNGKVHKTYSEIVVFKYLTYFTCMISLDPQQDQSTVIAWTCWLFAQWPFCSPEMVTTVMHHGNKPKFYPRSICQLLVSTLFVFSHSLSNLIKLLELRSPNLIVWKICICFGMSQCQIIVVWYLRNQ